MDRPLDPRKDFGITVYLPRGGGVCKRDYEQRRTQSPKRKIEERPRAALGRSPGENVKLMCLSVWKNY